MDYSTNTNDNGDNGDNGDNDANMFCVICQDVIMIKHTAVSMGKCGHKFHGQCCVDLLLHFNCDKRCPMCRDQCGKGCAPKRRVYGEGDVESDVSDDSDDESDDSSSSSDDDPDDSQRISLAEAVKAARADKKIKPMVDKTLKVIRKHQVAMQKANRTSKQVAAELRPAYEKVEKRIAAYAKKQVDGFQHRYANKIIEHDNARNEWKKAKTGFRNGQRRVATKYATKYGFELASRSR
jgi:hypothetical protein